MDEHQTTAPTAEFWRHFLRALETEPRVLAPTTIRGASGLTHPVIALGIDDRRRRAIVISAESDARAAALAQADIQASMPDVRVVTARPAPVNLSGLATFISTLIGGVEIGPKELAWLNANQSVLNERVTERMAALGMTLEQFAEQAMLKAVHSCEIATFSTVAYWKEVVQQLGLIEFVGAGPTDRAIQLTSADPGADVPIGDGAVITTGADFGISFRRLQALDPATYDRVMGVCSVPLYGLSADDIDALHTGGDIERVRAVLRSQDVLQFFFPPADQLALGLAELLPATAPVLAQQLTAVPAQGHPYGELEILPSATKLSEVVDALHEKGLVVDGEQSIEVTSAGTTYRSLVRYKPREGLLSRLSHVFSLKLDLNLKDLFK